MQYDPTIPAAKNIDLTAFQKELHGMSTKQVARKKTRGAFGGVAKDERALRSVRRRFGK